MKLQALAECRRAQAAVGVGGALYRTVTTRLAKALLFLDRVLFLAHIYAYNGIYGHANLPVFLFYFQEKGPASFFLPHFHFFIVVSS